MTSDYDISDEKIADWNDRFPGEAMFLFLKAVQLVQKSEEQKLELQQFSQEFAKRRQAIAEKLGEGPCRAEHFAPGTKTLELLHELDEHLNQVFTFEQKKRIWEIRNELGKQEPIIPAVVRQARRQRVQRPRKREKE